MLRLKKIFYDAICADSALMHAIGNRVKSTCFEVAPEVRDNTAVPYIIIIDEGKQPAQTTKDDGWMPSLWHVNVGVEIAAQSENDVDDLMLKAMQAIANHIQTLYTQGIYIPYPNEGTPQTQGVAWDWTKPCYFDVAHYQCDVENTDDDEI